MIQQILTKIQRKIEQDPLIAGKTRRDGCWYRAVRVMEYMIEEDIDPQAYTITPRFFIPKFADHFFGQNDELTHRSLLFFNNPKTMASHFYSYHVAAGARINGRDVILDPFLLSGPVPLDEWIGHFDVCVLDDVYDLASRVIKNQTLSVRHVKREDFYPHIRKRGARERAFWTIAAENDDPYPVNLQNIIKNLRAQRTQNDAR